MLPIASSSLFVEHELIPEEIYLSDYVRYTEFSPLCVWSTMQSMPQQQVKGLIYARCESATAEFSPDRPDCHGSPESCALPRPCLSKNYVMAVYDSLMDVSDCLGVSPKELFTIFRGESNLMVNAGSARFIRGRPIYHPDWGIAQLTPPAIHALNATPALRSLKQRPACGKFAALLTPDLSADKPCGRMAAPANPARSFLYGGLLYLLGKESMRRMVDSAISQAGLPINAGIKEALVRHLARYTYNAGTVPIESAFRKFTSERGLDIILTSDFRAQFSSYLAEHFGDGMPWMYEPKVMEIKKKGVAGYAPGLEKWVPSTFYGPAPQVQCVDR
jgi:hypothetical protein